MYNKVLNLVVFLIFFFFVETDGQLKIILKCFSLRQSFRSLVDTSEESQNPVYFLKFIMMLFVVVGHRWLFSLSFPLFQTEELEMVSFVVYV